MAKKDIVVNRYMSERVRFADMMNGSLFQGKQIVIPENLMPLDSESSMYLQDKNGKEIAIARYRDVVMGTDFAILAEENQSAVHYAMPVRGMVYDSLSYANQVEELRKKHLKEKTFSSSAEFLSGMKKEDKLTPVITLVVYYGEEEWDGSLDLHEMLDYGENQEIKDVIKGMTPNYKINLVDVSKINNTKIYKTDLQVIFEMLKYRKDKNGLKKYVAAKKEELKQMDEDAFHVLGVLLHDKRWSSEIRNKEGGNRTMCQAIDEWAEELLNEGEQIGMQKSEQIAKEQLLEIAKGLKDLLPCEAIAEKMKLPIDVVAAL